PYSVSLRWFTIAASVVDLPEPVGPVTSTRPRGLSARSPKILGQLSCSSVRILDGMVRNTAPAPRFWLKALTRKRARPWISNEKSHSSVSSKCLRWASFMMSYIISWTCLWSSASTLMRRTSPFTRIIGGRPADKWRSEALFLTEKASSWVISMDDVDLSFVTDPLWRRSRTTCNSYETGYRQRVHKRGVQLTVSRCWPASKRFQP